MRRPVVLTVAAALISAACSGGDSDADTSTSTVTSPPTTVAEVDDAGEAADSVEAADATAEEVAASPSGDTMYEQLGAL
ncbi:MAG: hypothetical protein AAFP84_20390, partial [Actinomycetota bacterium]